MASVACVIVGIDGWQEFTLPAVLSILKHEPKMRIVLVDAGSKHRYSEEPDAPPIDYVRLNKSHSYAGAMNFGVDVADADWTIILNNDILCHAKFAKAVMGLDPHVVHGMQLIEFGDLRWLGGWIYAISRECRKAVGDFDEQFEACGFEDADYCFRAAAAGFPVALMHLPFEHLWGKTRWGLKGYNETREMNLKRVEAKHHIRIGESWMWRVTEGRGR